MGRHYSNKKTKPRKKSAGLLMRRSTIEKQASVFRRWSECVRKFRLSQWVEVLKALSYAAQLLETVNKWF